MINESGGEIPGKKVKEINRKISKLSVDKIDRLFNNLNFVVSEYEGEKRPQKFDALHPKQIEEIKDSEGNSGLVKTLLLETPLENIQAELDKIENR